MAVSDAILWRSCLSNLGPSPDAALDSAGRIAIEPAIHDILYVKAVPC